MAKIPKKPEEIFPEITGDYRNIFGEDLISIILYGSGAGEDYVPGKSDLNFLIMLTERGIEGLDRVLETVGRWRKRNVAIPLFMTRDYLTGSQDAYPIEFLNMRRSYLVVTGEDVLAPLAFDPRHIRLQLERELRGKLLHLRSGYLATGEKTRKVRELIGASLTAFVSLFRRPPLPEKPGNPEKETRCHRGRGRGLRRRCRRLPEMRGDPGKNRSFFAGRGAGGLPGLSEGGQPPLRDDRPDGSIGRSRLFSRINRAPSPYYTGGTA